MIRLLMPAAFASPRLASWSQERRSPRFWFVYASPPGSLLVLFLFLAGRTVVGGPLSLRQLLDRLAANAARLAAALVHVELLAEVSGVAVRADVVPQRRAAHANRHLQDGAYRTREARHFFTLQRACL